MILLINLLERQPERLGRYQVLIKSRNTKTQREAVASWGGLEYTLVREDLATREYISHWWDKRLTEDFYSETLKKVGGG